MMQYAPLILTGIAVISLNGAAYLPDKIAINPTPSAPKGLYWISQSADIKRGDMVIVSVPDTYKKFVVERGYLAPNIPLIKQIVALKGDTVCSKNRQIFVNNLYMATALSTDSMGRTMPHWFGCLTLTSKQFFALMRAPNSLDSRYFGALNLDQIIGIAKPVWIVKAPKSTKITDQKEAG